MFFGASCWQWGKWGNGKGCWMWHQILSLSLLASLKRIHKLNTKIAASFSLSLSLSLLSNPKFFTTCTKYLSPSLSHKQRNTQTHKQSHILPQTQKVEDEKRSNYIYFRKFCTQMRFLLTERGNIILSSVGWLIFQSTRSQNVLAVIVVIRGLDYWRIWR